MSTLVRQRIRYLVEYGGLYPAGEPASKNFVMKVAIILIALDMLGMWLDYVT